ncbi:putative C2H2 finger domain protein [Aspergillus melleus]|uniref:putative C2H2 finger domain protein n=1 Tax=Aspergillus melleus TaxID=138277 RepID=UPI001E8E8514|nr:uncharacterized protein LDX57_007141 [Aspergillus melleus]KAH8429479.1 hypothetical protein LDX57_007141 [Aspergillus melleus]
MAPTTPSKVPCTFPGCSLIFDSPNEMIRHKILEPYHEYCKRCYEDFPDEERLLIHKMRSSKHIVCPICGSEYRSEGGRDAHIRQEHQAKQSITCRGCKERFTSASGLMRHIEDGECPVISQFMLLKERSKKMMIKEALNAGEGSPMPLIPDPAEADDINGGVKIQSAEERNREAMMNQPFVVRAGATGFTSAALATEHWPALNGSIKVSDEDLPYDVLNLSGLDISSQENKSLVWKGKARAASTLSGESVLGDRQFAIAPPNAGQTLRLMDQRWDAINFLNSFSGEYVCPCGTAFKIREDFEEHVLSKSRSNRMAQCPRCRRRFKTTAALIAHCESASTRCDINDGEKYGQVIDELTGGVIQAVGTLTDGTVKYEAGKLDIPKTHTVGTNLRPNPRTVKW